MTRHYFSPVSTVLAGTQAQPTFRADLTGDAAPFSAQLSRELLDGYDGAAVITGVYVERNGEDITADVVATSIEVRESLDEAGTRASFTIHGLQYSPYVTEDTWTRAGVWEVGYYQGLAGRVQRLPQARGPVVSMRSSGAGPVYAVEIADEGYKAEEVQVCFEVPPNAGKTRGEIAREECAKHGVELAIEDGAVYSKAVQVDNEPLAGWLEKWLEPAGLKVRRVGLEWEAFRPELKAEPRPPDWVWNLDDVASMSTSPPDSVASQWIVRSEQVVVEEDGDGQTIETAEITIEDFYAPVATVERQLEDGSVLVSGPDQPEATLQPVSTTIEETVSLGGRVLRKTAREFGWFNPRAAKWRTAGGFNGPVPPGYHYSEAYIDPGGEFRFWREERWVETNKRIEIYEFDEAGTETGVRVEAYAWHAIARAVRASDAPGEAPTVTGTLIAGDDRSYIAAETSGNVRAVDGYGLAQIQTATYTYGESGAETTESAETWQHYSIPAAANRTNFQLADGVVQKDLLAFMQVVHREVKISRTDDSGRLAAESTARNGYYVPRSLGGAFEYGDFKSNATAAVWATLARESREFRVGRDGTYVEVTADADGQRRETRHTGDPPLPRYLASAWTQTASQPIETIATDPTLEEWFGFRTEVVEHPYALNLAECGVVATDRRARQLAHEITIQRPETLAKPGDTVLIVNREEGIEHRALLIDSKASRNPATGAALATYTLEAQVIA